MKKNFLFSKIIFITTLLSSQIFFTFAKAETAEIFGPSALYKEESYTFVLDRNENIHNSDSKVKIYVYNPKLELAFVEEQIIDQASLQPFYFTIPPGTLSVGNYFMSIEAIDNVGKSRIVAQKDIGVLSNGKTWVTKNSEILLSFFAFVVVVAVIHHIARDRELYSTLGKMKLVKKKKSKKHSKK